MANLTTITISLASWISMVSLLAVWWSHTISRLVVHAILFLVIMPLLFRLARMAAAVDRLRRGFRITPLHFLCIVIWFFLVGWQWYASGSIHSVVPLVNPFSKQPLSASPMRDLWYNGFNLSPLTILVSSYDYLFQLTMKSRLFWRYIIPTLTLLTIYDWAVYIYEDFYILFKDLGLGGSGTSMGGWALARLRAYAANVDVFRPPRVPQTLTPYRGRLHTLPVRLGQRPKILGVTPQRQVDFPAPPNTQLVLEELMAEFVTSESGHTIEIRQSFLEPGLQALRRRLTIPTDERGGPSDPKSAFGTVDEFGGELFHGHRDGTSHAVLHPECCRRVLEGGWGERHPFCTRAWYWRLYFNWYLGIRLPVPEGLMIIYAPRDHGELQVIRQIIQAAVWYGTNGDLQRLSTDTYPFPPGPNTARAS